MFAWIITALMKKFVFALVRQKLFMLRFIVKKTNKTKTEGKCRMKKNATREWKKMKITVWNLNNYPEEWIWPYGMQWNEIESFKREEWRPYQHTFSNYSHFLAYRRNLMHNIIYISKMNWHNRIWNLWYDNGISEIFGD